MSTAKPTTKITCGCGFGPCPTHAPKQPDSAQPGIAITPAPRKPSSPKRLGREPGFSFPEAAC